MIIKNILLGSLALGACTMSVSAEAETSSTSSKDKVKVLYVTHEPGKYHKYTPQRKIFEEIAKRNNWKLVVMSGSQAEVENKLATDPNFGKYADVIVYNICMAHSSKLEAPHNIIMHTKEKGIPALLIHCSLHSFWPTYKENGGDSVHPEGANKKAKTKQKLLAEWKESHPGVEFPAWPNMTGIASTAHGPRQSLQATPIDSSHIIFKGVEKGYTTTDKAELYNNFINAEDSKNTVALMHGKQGNAEACILWEHPVGKSKSLSFTLGHDTAEWSQKEFQTILTNSVHYLAEKK